MNTVTINKRFNLDAEQADEVGNKAADYMSSHIQENYPWIDDFNFLEDGVYINSSDDEVFENTEGNFESELELVNELNALYFTEYERLAANI